MTPCPRCDGEGVAEVYDLPPGHPAHHPAWTHPETCPECGGAGTVQADDDIEEAA